jgi:hypothetical protein
MSNRGGICRIFDRRDVPSGNIVLPPFDTANIALAFDPDKIGDAQYVIGPIGVQHSAGADAFLAVKTQGSPSYYTYDHGNFFQRFDFGDVLNNIWTSTVGFTLYMAVQVAAGDKAIAHGLQLLSKRNTGSTLLVFDWWVDTTGGINAIHKFIAYYGNSILNTESVLATISLSNARHILAVTWDPTQARANRILLYVDGSLQASTGFSAGIDGTISSVAVPLNIAGANLGDALTQESYTYVYNNPHSAATVANISAWLASSAKNWV